MTHCLPLIREKQLLSNNVKNSLETGLSIVFMVAYLLKLVSKEAPKYKIVAINHKPVL